MEFLSISIDKNRDKWAEFVKNRKLKGHQLWLPKGVNEQFRADLGLRAYPTFILIDKRGRLITTDAPRPSAGQLETEILKFL